MERDLLKALTQWRIDPLRKPVILRGARQVGKSWLVTEFGKQFSSFITINFDKDKTASRIFDGDLNIPKIIQLLALHAQKPLIPGETLLFLDEIQECENALRALRYFKEELPELHVIAAGSLIDFVLENIGMPVGRVQFMYLYPLSFAEFLTVNNRDDLRKYIHDLQIDETIHEKILELLKIYMWLGGMPAVVNAWLTTQNPGDCQRLQDEIIEAYQQDFHKYARDRQIPYVTKVFENVPKQLGCKFKYAHIDSETRSFLLKNALELLIKAGIVYQCFHSSAQEQPLGALINEKRYKVFFFDIGLAQRLAGLDIKQWLFHPLRVNNSGNMAEQLVAQELISYAPYHKNPQLFYWHREAKSSNAEVDFLIIKNGMIIPVEVKSSRQGSMKSMQMFLENHPHSSYGLKISEGNFSKYHKIQEIPLYSLEAWLKSTKICSFSTQEQL